MDLKDEFIKMVGVLTHAHTIPTVEKIFFPPFFKGGQPKEAEFMALGLADGSAGISYVLLPDEKRVAYSTLNPMDFTGADPVKLALEFGHENPITQMIALAAINAICQHVMRKINFKMDTATDSLGLLPISPGERVGMVGLFYPLVKGVDKAGGKLVVIEKNHRLIKTHPHLNITLDPSELRHCTKVICTGTVVLNNTLDEILSHCRPGAQVSVIGPTAGYFPDPLFARGVDVLGGRVVKDGKLFFKLIQGGKRWGIAAEKVCFQKATYPGLGQLI